MSTLQKNHFYFLPGWGFKGCIWSTFAQKFCDYHILDWPLGIDVNLDEIIETWALQIRDNAILVAWSFSGVLALALAYRYPEKCRRLYLVSSVPSFGRQNDWPGIDSEKAQKFLDNFAQAPGRMMDQFIRLVAYPSHSIDINKQLKLHQMDPNYKPTYRLLYQMLKWLFQLDYRHLLSDLDKKVIYIMGNQDAILNDHRIKRLKNEYQKAHHFLYYSIDQAGHALMLTHPERLYHLLGDVK